MKAPKILFALLSLLALSLAGCQSPTLSQQVKASAPAMLLGDEGDTWHPWIELGQDESGAASNLSVISSNRIVVGTGNHAAKGKAYTLEVYE
jgi:hypothetical protein|tara:strand:+ start:1188 stop:1463 length:276 start_codon:yes stop_codon:yes gene_type:complete